MNNAVHSGGFAVTQEEHDAYLRSIDRLCTRDAKMERLLKRAYLSLIGDSRAPELPYLLHDIRIILNLPEERK